MNGPEILRIIRHDLQRAIARRDRPPILRPLDVSPWLAMSVLQKAIRRGREDLALSAAATLMRDAPDRLWRRIGCVAYEDVGVASLEAVGLATVALAGKRHARRRMGDRQLRCRRAEPSAELPGGRRSSDGLRASPRTRQGPRRVTAPDDPRLDHDRDWARVHPGAGVGPLVRPWNGSTSFRPRAPARRGTVCLRLPV
jgi:hypothetical protein